MSKPVFIPVDYNPFEEEKNFRSAPTTEPQREIFTNIMLGGDAANCAYNESVSLKLKGDFDFAAFEKAVGLLIQRHEALRASFANNGLLIRIADEMHIQIPRVDLSALGKTEKEKTLNELLAREVETPFDLEEGHLIRVSVIKLENDIHHVVLTLHHIVGDGWSLGMCMVDLGRLYSSVKNSTSHGLEKADSWINYAAEEEAYLQSKENEETENYWYAKYAGNVPVMDLQVNKQRPPFRTFAARRIDVAIEPAIIDKLKSAGAKAGCSLVNTMTAAFEIFLYRITGNEDVVVGLPAAGQSYIGKQNLIGHCVQLLPLRTSINPKEKFSNYLKQRKKTLLDDFDHQRFTFGSLLRKLNVARDPSRIPLVPVAFNIDIGLTNGVEFSGLEFAFSTNPRHYENFEWFINCSGSGNNLVIECTYNTDLFDDSVMQLRIEEFIVTLQSIASNPDLFIYEIELLTQREKQLLDEWNKTQSEYPADKGIHHLFEEMVLKYPGKTAVEFNNTSISYNDLNKKANQLAHHLQSKGLHENEMVCICLERSIEMVLALFAVMKAGGVYIPVDPDFPADRVAYMQENSDSKFFICSSDTKEKINRSTAVFILLDNGWEENYKGQPENIALPVNQYRHAYMIYTSGSTGKPKGVQIKHSSVVNLLGSFKKEISFNEKDSLLAITTVSFDIAGLELFLPLTAGGTLVLASKNDSLDVSKLIQCFRSNKINVFQATPATYKMLQAAKWIPAKEIRLLVGGEAVPAELAGYLTAHCDNVWNVYGPTETTIWSTVYKIPALITGEENNLQGIVKIGKPIANTSVYVLDDFLKRKPVGIEGDIYIGGEGLSSGYFNRPDLTDDRFIYTRIEGEDITRIYKTGDKGKFLEDGNLEYAGRSDFQVKIRGYRIELGEIESVIRQHPLIKDVVVHVKENKAGDKILVAYFVTKADNKDIIEQLRGEIKNKLPAYMMPAHFVTLDLLPLTPNGKVDRKALPEPEISLKTKNASEILLQISSTEEALVDIWKEILHLNRIGIKDNFFELGGHSLIGVQLFIEIEKRLGVKLNLQSLFKAPTIEELAKIIDKEESSIEWKPIVALQQAGTRTPLFCIHMHNGNIYRWKVLQKYLPDDQPIYAIQPKGLDEKQKPHRNIEEMAKYYIEIMRTVQPKGPYNLLGLCFGGMVVFEMALQLQAMGEKVALAAMVNNYAPLENHSYYRLRKEFEGFMKMDLGAKINYAIQKNLSLGKKIKNKALTVFSKPSANIPDQKEKETEDIRIIHTLALINYNPQKQFEGDIFAIRAGGPIEDPEFYDDTLGWKRLVKGSVDIVQVEGSNNDTIIEDDLYNSQLSLLLKNKLDEVWKYNEEALV